MYSYLNDMDFLTSLDKLHIRTQYARIILLDFSEQPIREIQGNVTAGSLTVNSASAIRRTISLTMVADSSNANIEDVENEISINKKVRIEVGFKNPLKSYTSYGDIIWFPCGLFVLSSANTSRGTNGWTISIQGKDKMCLLDGSAGGTLPASTSFHERKILLPNGDYEIQYTKIFDIIFEAVNHWGEEAADRIIITDIDDEVKMLVSYEGDRPIYFSSDYSSFSSVYSETNFPNKITNGQDAGYEITDFTYPGELILNAGDTVVTLLDKIVSVLGNFEYFYDLDGNFVFQEIKNYLNQQSPLLELTEDSYIKSYNNKKFLYSLTDLDTTTQITRTPKYDNIKNNFYVWGKRTTASGVEVDIRYHLAIDNKPALDLAQQWMWEISQITNVGGVEQKTILRYKLTDSEESDSLELNDGEIATLVGGPCGEWREELYRQALMAQSTNSVYNISYDSELLAEWRKLYDPTKWGDTNHWNPDVNKNPELLNFWLDFIDTSAEVGKYAVNEIGRRTKVVNNTDIKTIYNKEVPDVVFLENLPESATDNDEKERQDLLEKYNQMGQKYFFLTPSYYDLFTISTTGTSCFDEIRSMLYQYLNYNTTIGLTCLPKYYMEPNNIIYIEDRDSGIAGNFEITQFTLPLAYNGTMSITATEVLTRV